MAGPPFAAGATATTGVTKPASRVPSGWRSSTSTGYTPVRRSCRRVDSPRGVLGLEREGERPAAVLAGGEGVERELGLAEHGAQIPAFERSLEAGPRAHGLVRRGAHDEAGSSRRLTANLEAQREVAADRDPGRLAGEHQARRVRRGVGRRGRRVDAGAGGQRAEHENGSGRQHDGRGAPQSVRPSTHSPTGSRRKPHDS